MYVRVPLSSPLGMPVKQGFRRCQKQRAHTYRMRSFAQWYSGWHQSVSHFSSLSVVFPFGSAANLLRVEWKDSNRASLSARLDYQVCEYLAILSTKRLNQLPLDDHLPFSFPLQSQLPLHPCLQLSAYRQLHAPQQPFLHVQISQYLKIMAFTSLHDDNENL